MSACPLDAKPCMNDLCHGGGCLRAGGMPMLEPCPACGVDTDGEFFECACDAGEEGDL